MSAHKSPQTPPRIDMQKNGYAWVPNNGKRTRGRDWPAEALKRLGNPSYASALWWDDDPSFEDDEGRQIALRNPSTGLLVEGDLVAIDVDVDSKDAVDALFHRAAAIFGENWADGVLERYRDGTDKVCSLFRAGGPLKGDTPFPREGKVIGPNRYLAPGVDQEDVEKTATKDGWTKTVAGEKPQTIEFFRGGECQIGVLGPHTLPDDEGQGGIDYQWTCHAFVPLL